MFWSKPYLPAFCIAVLLTVLVFAATGCEISITINDDDESSAIRGSGQIETQTFELAPFSNVDASDALRLAIEVIPGQHVEARLDDNLIDRLTVEVRNGTLYLSCERCELSPGATLLVQTSQLDRLVLSGATQAELGTFESQSLSLEVSGASLLAMTDGLVAELTANISGASSLAANSAAVGRLQIELSGASRADISVTDAVTGNISGASTLQLSSEFDPDVDVAVTGASRLLR